MANNSAITKLVFFAVIILGCQSAKHVQQVKLPAFDKEGHRGCRGLMPENTIPAMLKALDLGVTTLETDIVITRDSQLVLSHEPFFNHGITTKADGSYIAESEERSYNIFQMTYAETQQFDVGLKPNSNFPRQQKLAIHKPLLSEMIDAVKGYCHQHHRSLPFFNIETKTKPATDNIFHPDPSTFVRLLMDVIRKKNIAGHVIIQSFDIRTLKIIHERYPGIKTALLIEGFNKHSFDENINELGFTPTIYSPEYSLVKDELIEQCHKKNIKVIPWTVDTKDEMDRLKKLGVDGIITDYPDLFSL